MIVADWAWARPDPQAVKDAGYDGVMRYVSRNAPGEGKNLTAGERDALHAAGLKVGLVWETTETRPREGYEAGRVDGIAANEYADRLGFPDDRPLYFAVDRRETTAGMVLPYFTGVRDHSRREWGAYGSTEILVALRDQLGCRWLWKVETWGPAIDGCALIQLPNTKEPHIAGTATSAYDVNAAADDWGGWPHVGAPTPKPEKPKPKHRSRNMIFQINDGEPDEAYQYVGGPCANRNSYIRLVSLAEVLINHDKGSPIVHVNLAEFKAFVAGKLDEGQVAGSARGFSF